HQSKSGKLLASRKGIIIRSVGDQSSMGPMAVWDQSNSRMSDPISPPPTIQEASAEEVSRPDSPPISDMFAPVPCLKTRTNAYWREPVPVQVCATRIIFGGTFCRLAGDPEIPDGGIPGDFGRCRFTL